MRGNFCVSRDKETIQFTNITVMLTDLCKCEIWGYGLYKKGDFFKCVYQRRQVWHTYMIIFFIHYHDQCEVLCILLTINLCFLYFFGCSLIVEQNYGKHNEDVC